MPYSLVDPEILSQLQTKKAMIAKNIFNSRYRWTEAPIPSLGPIGLQPFVVIVKISL